MIVGTGTPEIFSWKYQEVIEYIPLRIIQEDTGAFPKYKNKHIFWEKIQNAFF